MPTEAGVLEQESEFVSWAEAELRRAGLFDEGSDFDGMLGDEVMRLVRTFAEAGHSGMSAMITGDIFGRLVEGRALTPLTNDPDEWMHIEADMAGNATTWQSRRQGSCFSNDGGRTFYDIEEDLPRWRRAAEWLTRRTGVYRGWMFHPRHVAADG